MRPTPLLLSILAAIGCSKTVGETEMCMDVDDDVQACPAPSEVDVDGLYHQEHCDYEADEVLGEGVISSNPWDTGATDQICCYPVIAKDPSPNSDCMVGRPFREEGRAMAAPVIEAGGWGRHRRVGHTNAVIAEAWMRGALLEHASIAAFAKLTLDLMALGAPAALLAEVQQAGLDEVEHARLAFELASRFAGVPLSPGPFPFTQPILPCTDLAQLAADAVREGCVGETVGAWLAEAMADRAEDREVRLALRRIAEDEARHAALSWKLVAWAIAQGGEEVRVAVRQAFGEPLSLRPLVDEGVEAFPAMGAIDSRVHLALCREAIDAVVRPAAEALLAA